MQASYVFPHHLTVIPGIAQITLALIHVSALILPLIYKRLPKQVRFFKIKLKYKRHCLDKT